MSFLSQLAQETLAVAQEAEQRELDQLQSEEGTAKAKAEEEALDAALSGQTNEEVEIAQDYDELDEVVATVDELKKVEGFVEARVTEGGMSPNEARAIEIATESIYRRLGIDVRPMKDIALESFGHPATSKQVSLEFLDGVKQAAKQVWEAIKRFFSSLWEKIKLFIASLKISQKKLMERASGMKLQAEQYLEKHGNDTPPKPVQLHAELLGSTGDIEKDAPRLIEAQGKIAQSIGEFVKVLVDESPSGMIQSMVKAAIAGQNSFDYAIPGGIKEANGDVYFGVPKNTLNTQIYIKAADGLKFDISVSGEQTPVFEINSLQPKAVIRGCQTIIQRMETLIKETDFKIYAIKNASTKATAQKFSTDAEYHEFAKALIFCNKAAIQLIEGMTKILTVSNHKYLKTLKDSMDTWPTDQAK